MPCFPPYALVLDSMFPGILAAWIPIVSFWLLFPDAKLLFWRQRLKAGPWTWNIPCLLWTRFGGGQQDSCVSVAQLCPTLRALWAVAQKAPLSMEFSRQEFQKSESEVAQSCSTLCDSMDYSTQGSSSTEFSRQGYWSGLPFPSPGDPSRPRDWTQVSHTAGRLFPVWATGEAQRIPEGLAISSFRGSSRPRDRTHDSFLAGRFFTTQTPGEPWTTSLAWLFLLRVRSWIIRASLRIGGHSHHLSQSGARGSMLHTRSLTWLLSLSFSPFHKWGAKLTGVKWCSNMTKQASGRG